MLISFTELQRQKKELLTVFVIFEVATRQVSFDGFDACWGHCFCLKGFEYYVCTNRSKAT
jgi:hypothetical protein